MLLLIRRCIILHPHKITCMYKNMMNSIHLNILGSYNLAYQPAAGIPAPSLKTLMLIFHDLDRLLSHNRLHATTSSMLTYTPVEKFLFKYRSLIASDSSLIFENTITSMLRAKLPMENTLAETACSTSITTTAFFNGPQSLIESYNAALIHFQELKDPQGEYVLRRLFTQLILVSPSKFIEAIPLAIEIEKDLMESSKISALHETFGSPQSRYDMHLIQYLDLLQVQFKFTSCSSQNIDEKYIHTLSQLHALADDEHFTNLSLDDKVLLKRSLAYLLTRPEWLFYQNPLLAKKRLLEAKNSVVEISAQQTLELDLIDLETRNATNREISSVKYIDKVRRRLETLINDTKNTTVADTIRALMQYIQIFEQIALTGSQPEACIELIKKSLATLLILGERQGTLFNLNTRQCISHCRWLYSFYLLLCPKTPGEFHKGRQMLAELHQDPWLDTSLKPSIQILQDSFPPDFMSLTTFPIDSARYQLLLRFKLLLLQEHHAFLRSYLSSTSTEPEEALNAIQDVESFLQQEVLPLKDFALDFVKNLSGPTKHLLEFWYCHILLKAKNAFYSNLDSSTLLQLCCMADQYPYLEYWILSNAFIDSEQPVPLSGFNKLQPEDIEGFEETSATTEVVIQNSRMEILFFATEQLLEALKTLQGKLSYTKTLQHAAFMYVYEVAHSRLISNILPDSKFSMSKAESMEINKMRQHKNSLMTLCHVLHRHVELSHVFLTSHEDPYLNLIMDNAIYAGLIGQKICDTNGGRLYWTHKMVECVEKKYYSFMQTGSDEKLEDIFVEWLHYKLCTVKYIDDPDDKLAVWEQCCNLLPNTFDEIVAYLFESNFHTKITRIKNLSVIIMIEKAKHLLFTQQTEQGLSLFHFLLDMFFPEKMKLAIKTKASKMEKKRSPHSASNVSPLVNFTVKEELPWINEKKLDRSPYFMRKQLSRPSSSPPQHTLSSSYLEDHSDKGSLTKETKSTALGILHRQQVKRDKKQARTSSSSSSSSSSLNTPLTSPAPQRVPTRKIMHINKNCHQLFSLFWVEKRPSPDTPWEKRSFRNDFKITRNEVLQIIHALGGAYHPERGHGSHHVAHLPKIEFDGCDMGGLIDMGSNELMVVLTNNMELTHYQKIQFRQILLKQGFTPDTVKARNTSEQ